MKVLYFSEIPVIDSWEFPDAQAVSKQICLSQEKIDCAILMETVGSQTEKRLLVFPADDAAFLPCIHAFIANHPTASFGFAATATIDPYVHGIRFGHVGCGRAFNRDCPADNERIVWITVIITALQMEIGK